LKFTSVLAGRIAGVIDAGRSRTRERELMHMLREADRTKSDFVSILAHELRGPMTTIRGLSETVQKQWDGIDESRRKDFLGIVAKEIDRLARLVNDLLDLSRMDAGTLRYDLEPVALVDLVENVLTVHPSLRAQHLVTSALPDDLPKVLGDRERIHQVLLNLISNANRYSPQGTTVTILGDVIDEPGGRAVRIGVKDEGIGIAEEDMDRLFAKFATLPKPSWTAKGTGLGLYISKGIVEAHGGRIWAESEPGKGSTFYFTMILANGEQRADAR
ncbi:MAG: sensor histidine kinase, partial [Actinomycetota bacterium]